MKTSEPILFDTNILIYNQDEESPHYSFANEWHERLYDEEISVVVSLQNITEFMAVITNPRRVKKAHSFSRAISEIQKYMQLPGLSIIYPNTMTPSFLLKLLEHRPAHQRIFDTQLVATMLSNEVHTILTFNEKDFAHFGDIKVITP